MKTDILNNFLVNEIKLSSNINWGFAFNSLKNINDLDQRNNELINYVAFSFLDVTEKKKLFGFIKDSQVSEKRMDDLFDYFERYFLNLGNTYPLKNNLYKDFIHNLLNWIEITNGVIDEKAISSLLKNVQSHNDVFWLLLVKELHDRKLYLENLLLLSKKKSKFKKNKFSEDFILYEILTITSLPNYVYNNKQVDKLCQLSTQIISYDTSRLFYQLECALLKSNKPKFESLMEKNNYLLSSFTVIELLYIYEYAVLISSENSIEVINVFLYKQDISSYIDTYESDLYNFFNLLNKKEYLEIMRYIRRLHDRSYNFKHVLWYLEKKVGQKIFVTAIKSIIEA